MAYISITTKDNISKLWYSLLKKRLPAGTILPKDGHIMKKTNDTLTVFLTRDLNQTEITDISNSFTYDGDYDIKASSPAIQSSDKVVKIEKSNLDNLLSKWSKRKHDNWMNDKLEKGWKYSPSYSEKNKTHPLLRQWSDLPADYKKIDITEFEEMIEFINDNGYTIVPSV